MMGDLTTIKDVFVQCQTGLQAHGKLIKTLHKIYDKTEFASFWSEFCHYLKYAMIIFKREPAVERVIDFVSKFIPSLSKKSKDEDENEEDSVADNKLLQEMFDFLLQSHSAKDRGVRFRCCQLINKLLTNLGEEAQIDDDLYDRLYECMLDRLKDKCPVVRYHAVLAMSRLQDPTDENCPVIKAYLFLLNCDPNPDVRRAVLSSIAPSTKTLSSIVGRTRDVKDTVRKVAYEVLSEKIHVKALSIALRLQLVNEGLNDRAEAVKQVCSGKLLQSWLRTFGENIVNLLKSLDVEDSTDICSNVLEKLFKASSVQDVVDRFDILNENLLVPEENLTSESALYWQVVCKYIHSMGNDGDVYMEKVLPTCVHFCAYVQRYVDEMKVISDPEIQLGREFIIEQLIKIASYMDTADSASRKALETLLHNMLMADYISYRLVKPVVLRICELRGTSDSMVPYFAETVSEIREPITVVEKSVEEEEKRQLNVKIAGIRVKLNQLREDLEVAVQDQDFSRAAEIKAVVAELDTEKVQLLEASEPAREEIRTEKNDPLTILKCQTIISEMLQQLKLVTVSPTLQMMIESQIVPGIQNEDEDVRNMAMRALGLCCYLNKDLLVTYIPLFMQASQIDTEGVRVTALQILFDLLLIYGLEIVDASESSSSTSENQNGDGETSTVTEESVKNDSRSGIASKLVAIICSFLDGESSELRTCAAEGLAKLLMSGRVVSSKILSHLILLWYNPLSEDDTHLRDCLGTFFPVYALAGRSNQEVVEEAFLPTLRTLLNAPASSPLAEVDVNNVAELLVQLTNTKLITQNQNAVENSQDNVGHDNLSETICNEILSDPVSTNVKLWVKILNQMEVSPDNEVVLKGLRVFCYKMVACVKEKFCLKGLQKYQCNITEMASKFVLNDDDLQLAVAEETMEEPAELTDQTEETPRKKRVRGLYSQNMTLGMVESESELDITQDTSMDVDASCLISRLSTSDTPSRRSRKNTTEVAGEDEPKVSESRKQVSLEKNAEKSNMEVAPEEVVLEVFDTQSAADKETPKTILETSPEKRSRSEKKNSTAKKSPSKRQESKSPSRKSSSSPSKKSESQTKRKESKFPAKRSLTSPTKTSKSSAKRQESQSPVRNSSKSPEKKSDSPAKRKASNSPARKSSTSPAKKSKPSPKGKGSKSPARKLSKSPARKPSKSPEKKARSKSTEKGKKSTEKTSAKNAEKKSVSKSPEKKLTSKSPKEITKPKQPEKKTASKSPQQKKSVHATADKKIVTKTATKPVEKNVRKAPSRVTEVVTRSPANPNSRLSTSVTAVKSPRSVRQTKSKVVTGTPELKSPRNIRRAPELVVADTPEMKSPRHVTRKSLTVMETPELKSPRSISSASDKSSASTPSSIQSKRTVSRSTTAATGAKASTRSTRDKPKITAPSASKKPTRAGKSSASSSASDSTSASPEKSMTPSTRTEKRKMAESSEDLSSVSSPEFVTRKTTRTMRNTKPVPVKKITGKTVVEDSEEDDDNQLRRKARPSRRSATAATSVTAEKSNLTPSSTRSVKSSSQNSEASPAVKSPHFSRRATVKVNETRKNDRSASRDTDQENKAPSLRNTRGGPAVSTSDSNTSRTSPKRSAAAAKLGAAGDSLSKRSVRGSTTKKPATPRSQISDSDVSTPGSSRSTRSLKTATDTSSRTLRTKATDDMKQNLDKKLKESGKPAAGSRKELPSRAKRLGRS